MAATQKENMYTETKLKDCTFQVGGVGGGGYASLSSSWFALESQDEFSFYLKTLIILKIPQGYKKQGGKTK